LGATRAPSSRTSLWRSSLCQLGKTHDAQNIVHHALFFVHFSYPLSSRDVSTLSSLLHFLVRLKKTNFRRNTPPALNLGPSNDDESMKKQPCFRQIPIFGTDIDTTISRVSPPPPEIPLREGRGKGRVRRFEGAHSLQLTDSARPIVIESLLQRTASDAQIVMETHIHAPCLALYC